MANVKKGHLVGPPEWWKHLRRVKRLFWKRQRQAEKRIARAEGDRLDVQASEPGSRRRPAGS